MSTRICFGKLRIVQTVNEFVDSFTGQIAIICLSFIERPVDQSPKPQVGSNRPKLPPPPPLFCLLVRYSGCVMSHDVTLRKHISHIEHLTEDLVEPPQWQIQGALLVHAPLWVQILSFWHTNFLKHSHLGSWCPPWGWHPPWEILDLLLPPQWPNREIFFRLDLSISFNFQQLWFIWQKSLPPQWPNRGKFLDWIYPFHAISSNFGSAGRKAHPPFPPFRVRPSLCHTCRIPMVPILQNHTQIPPIQISFLGYQLSQLFKILTYTEVQDTGSWCRWKAYRQPYHNNTNIPAITVTVLAMVLWSVIRILYLYACILLTG